MINSDNKQLLFDLLYRLHTFNGDLNKLNSYIDFLKKEFSLLESSDILNLNIHDFDTDLKAEWESYVFCRKGHKILKKNSNS